MMVSAFNVRAECPKFEIPKTAEQCSFIFDCKLGNKAYNDPN